ncbi:MAG: hypothetical protein ABWK53_01370 [Anaerolineales bacterium]
MPSKQKRFHLLIAVLVLVSVACTCAIPGLSSRPSIVGSWEADYRGDRVGFVFESSGNFSISINGNVAGHGRYTVNDNVTPYQLDLLYDDGVRIYTIFDFTDANTMRLENAEIGAPRPTTFSDYGVFRRLNP